MKILKRGKTDREKLIEQYEIHFMRATCNKCGTKFEFELKDAQLRYSFGYYIVACPHCGNPIEEKKWKIKRRK